MIDLDRAAGVFLLDTREDDPSLASRADAVRGGQGDRGVIVTGSTAAARQAVGHTRSVKPFGMKKTEKKYCFFVHGRHKIQHRLRTVAHHMVRSVRAQTRRIEPTSAVRYPIL